MTFFVCFRNNPSHPPPPKKRQLKKFINRPTIGISRGYTLIRRPMPPEEMSEVEVRLTKKLVSLWMDLKYSMYKKINISSD